MVIDDTMLLVFANYLTPLPLHIYVAISCTRQNKGSRKGLGLGFG